MILIGAPLAVPPRGYRILTRMAGSQGAEIDVFARRGRTGWFCEVSYRIAVRDDVLDDLKSGCATRLAEADWVSWSQGAP